MKNFSLMVAGFVCAGFSVLCFGVAFAQVVSPIDTGGLMAFIMLCLTQN